MKELVQLLARRLVNDPYAVEVKETRVDTASVLELRVAKEDLGLRDRQAGSERQCDPHHSERNRLGTNRKVVLEIIAEK